MAISPRTEAAYHDAVRHVGQYFNKAPDLVSAEEFRPRKSFAHAVER